MKIHTIRIGDRTFEYWYDRSTRCWWAAEFGDDLNQIGDAQHAYSKDEILQQIDYLHDINDEAA